jgi:hypothetical protein
METIGLLAAGCVLATFCMESMVALRTFAIASNVLFIIYGAGANLLPIVALHAILLPINGWSLGKLCGGRLGAFMLGLGTAFTSCLLAGMTMRPALASASSHTIDFIHALFWAQ